MKNLPIIKDIFAIINFNECKSQEEEEAIRKSQLRLIITFFIICVSFSLMEILKIKWTNLHSPFFAPAIIAIIIGGISGGVLWYKKEKILEIIEIYKIGIEQEKYKKEMDKTTPISKITMEDGSTISGKFIETKGGWLQSLENNTLYNKRYISKIETI